MIELKINLSQTNEDTECNETNTNKDKPCLKDLNVHQPTEFKYNMLLGSGAFGKVRKCNHLKKAERL